MPTSPRPSRRVLLIGDSSLLKEGIAGLLMAELDLEVENAAYADDTTFVQDILRVQPEVVVLKETPSLDLTRFFQLLRDVQFEETLRVIVVHLDDKALDVYEKQRVLLVHSQDFVRLIRGASRHSDSPIPL